MCKRIIGSRSVCEYAGRARSANPAAATNALGFQFMTISFSFRTVSECVWEVETARSLQRVPIRIRLVSGHGLRDLRRPRAQVALVHDAAVVDDEGHHAGRAVLRRVRDERSGLPACR